MTREVMKLPFIIKMASGSNERGKGKGCSTMGWESRNGRSYYYRKERDGARVRSIYVGCGETAGLIAQFEEMLREEREENRLLARLERERVQAQDAELDTLGEMIRELAAATLIAHGYHQHKREWRRRRT